MCMYYFLQFFNNPIINYLVKYFKDTTKFMVMKQLLNTKWCEDFMMECIKGGTMVIICGDFYFINNVFLYYYNKTNSRIVGLILKIMGCHWSRNFIFPDDSVDCNHFN